MSQYRMDALISGVKFFDGVIEGREYKMTTVYCLVDLDDSRGTAKGQAAGSYKAEGLTLWNKLKDAAFPVNAELLIKETTNGKDQTKKVLLDVRINGNNAIPAAPKAA